MTLHDVAVLNDALEAHDHEDVPPEVPHTAQMEIHVSHADSITSFEWQQATGPWSDFVDLLLDHPEQDTKDGQAFLPGSLRGHRRTNAEVELLNLFVYDLDRGERLASVRQKVIDSGFEAVLHSTHSHLSSRSVVALTAYRAFVGQQNVDRESVARYLAEAKRFPNHVLEGLNVASLDEHSGTIEVEHGSIEKYRLVVLPDRVFPVGDLLAQGKSLSDVKELWKATYCAIGRHLGLDFDTACTDLARAYYFPSHAPGAPYVAEHYPGRPLSFETFLADAIQATRKSIADTAKGPDRADIIVTDRDGRTLNLRSGIL